LDGLRVAGPSGWHIVQKQLEEGRAGETFAATVLAVESRDADRIAAVLELGTVSDEHVRGLISGLGWLPHALASGVILAAFDKKTPVFRRIAIAGTAVHRVNPGDATLEFMLADQDPGVQARAAKAVGELGARSALAAVYKRLPSDLPDVRFAAAWT